MHNSTPPSPLPPPPHTHTHALPLSLFSIFLITCYRVRQMLLLTAGAVSCSEQNCELSFIYSKHWDQKSCSINLLILPYACPHGCNTPGAIITPSFGIGAECVTYKLFVQTIFGGCIGQKFAVRLRLIPEIHTSGADTQGKRQ